MFFPYKLMLNYIMGCMTPSGHVLRGHGAKSKDVPSGGMHYYYTVDYYRVIQLFDSPEKECFSSFNLLRVSSQLGGTVSVHLHGTGRRTVAKLQSFDLHVVEQIAPDVLILEIGTNDLVNRSPDFVGSEIESLVCLLVEDYNVCAVCV